MGIRTKLFVVFVAVIAVAGLVTLGYLEVRLRHLLVENEASALTRQAESYRAALHALDGDRERADQIANRIGSEQPVRLTVIDADGSVLAESDGRAGELRDLDDHSRRPEVTTARAGEIGVSQRYSTTAGADMLYVAVPYDAPGGRVVVRAATPLSAVDAVIAQLRIALGFAGLLGVLGALLMSGFASHLTRRTLRTLVDGARRLADSSTTRPIELGSRDEMANIAGSVNRLAAELTRSLEDLAEERDRVSAILASMREGVLALDEDHRVTLANPAALELLGLGQAPLGRSLVEVMRQPAVLDVADRTTDAPVDETEIELPGPPPRRVRVRASKRRGGEGVVLVLHDVTEMRRLEAVRSEFVANVSHELRTPVAVIRANAEALQDGALHDEERASTFVDALHRNAERLSQLVEDLLDLARLEREDVAPVIVDVPLADACERVVEPLRPRAASRGQALSVSVPEALAVRGDERALEQVLANLVDNALKYTQDNGAVEVRAALRGEVIVIEVADDGPGVPRAQRERVFERFYRLDAGRSRDMGGTGLGLAIVKHLVLSMEGRVGVRANEPRGSVFFVELPAAG